MNYVKPWSTHERNAVVTKSITLVLTRPSAQYNHLH